MHPGDRVGPYEIRGALGAGGMGELAQASGIQTRARADLARTDRRFLGPLLVGSPEW